MTAGLSSHLPGSHSLAKSSHVSLADNSTTNIAGLGSVILNLSLTLDFVLHIPSFPQNLISVSKLTHSLNYSVTSFLGYCVF